MKEKWLDWLDWSSQESRLWAYDYLIKKAPTFAVKGKNLHEEVAGWPSRRVPRNKSKTDEQQSLLTLEHKMRNAYAQRNKRHQQGHYKSYNLWMRKSLARKLHKMAFDMGSSIGPSIERLIDDFDGEVLSIKKNHKNEVQQQKSEHQSQLKQLKEQSKRQQESIASLQAEIDRLNQEQAAQPHAGDRGSPSPALGTESQEQDIDDETKEIAKLLQEKERTSQPIELFEEEIDCGPFEER